MAPPKLFSGSRDGWDYGDIFGEDSFFNQNSSLFGLAGAGFDMWNGMQQRDLQEEYMKENLAMNKEKLKMTQQSYNNELYRSNSIEDQMAGGKSKYSGGRQYVGPKNTQPGYGGQANQYAAAPTDSSAYVPHQAGPAAGPSNYNATAYGPTKQNAANYAGGLAGAAPKKPVTL